MRVRLGADSGLQVAGEDEDLDIHGGITVNSPAYPAAASNTIPNSPPPSFRSRPETPNPNSDLTDSFDSPSDDEDGDDMRNARGSQNANFHYESIPLVSTASTPTSSAATGGRVFGGGQTDGVFANISAKPTASEKLEEHPPVSLTQYGPIKAF